MLTNGSTFTWQLCQYLSSSFISAEIIPYLIGNHLLLLKKIRPKMESILRLFEVGLMKSPQTYVDWHFKKKATCCVPGYH
jgi:hypothetical protein